MATTARRSLALPPDDIETVENIRHAEADQNALRALGITVSDNPTAAEILRALVAAGIQAVQNKALEAAYAREAEFMKTDPECQKWRQARRNRRNHHPFIETQAADVA